MDLEKPKRPPLATYLWRMEGRFREYEWDKKCSIQASRLDDLLRAPRWTVMRVVCELPTFFESAGGLMVASQNDLVKLAYQVGVYGGIAYRNHVAFEPVPVWKWKGQLPKEVVNRRIVRTLGVEACKDFKADVWDSVGIGLWAKGEFE